jgi:hypothetical protein
VSQARQAATVSYFVTSDPVVQLGSTDTRHDAWPEDPYQDLDGVLPG